MQVSQANTTVIQDPARVTLGTQTLKPTSRDGQLESSIASWVSPDASLTLGIWECEAGEFTATRTGRDETCQILFGTATVIPDGGDAIHLVPGSILVTPDGWSGTWVVHERIRKTFVVRLTK